MAYVPSSNQIPPYVGAGARVKIGVANPTIGITYHVSVLLQPAQPPTTLGAPNDWTFGPGTTFSWPYIMDGGVWGGSNTSLITEVSDLLTHLKTGYGTEWSLSLLGLQHYDPVAKVWLRGSPFPTVTAQTGTFGTNPSGPLDPLLGNVTTLVLPTQLAPSDPHSMVGRLVLKLPGWELNPVTKRTRGITSSTTPSGIVTANVTGLIGYLSGSATRAVGHNGGQAENLCSVGSDCSHRIMRAIHLVD